MLNEFWRPKMKTRQRWLIVIAAALLLTTTVIVLPQIIGAKRSTELPAEKSLSVALVPMRSTGQNEKSSVIVGASVHNDTSPPLREMKQEKVEKKVEHEANENPKVPASLKHKDSPDTAVQSASSVAAFAGLNMPSPLLNFDGIAFPGVACNCAPPDTNGEVGATQYVQIVNEGFQVFDKTTGASLLGPSGITTLWSGFGGLCQTSGHGDPVVLYDQIANRWVITQFAGSGVPTDECVAVSTTSDATGSFNRYDFHLGSNFFDYPHLSVWPDAYYMSMNVFNSSGTAFLGPQPFAFDRTKMLAGQPATFITTGITGGSNEEVYLPADLDGSTLPPSGAPVSFVQFPGGGAFRVFHFHVDFVTPLNSTFTLFCSPASAAFTVRSTGVPQLGTTATLDPIGDRLMFRVATRFFADGHESAVGNFTVNSSSVASIRWFELRNTTAGPVTVFQQGTYQPDTTHRWMGSAAMDQQGNIAVGYSASSSSINPQIRYAGRLAGDPVNTLPQAEVHLFDGTGSQTGTNGRWGDYSDMTIDPVDDCTFWYTQEYYATTTSFAWRTRIGSFKFPGCGGVPTPDYSLSASPASQTVAPGASTSYTVTVTPSGGFSGTVTFSVSGLPAGAGASFNPPSVNTSGSSTMNVTTSASTPVGSYPLTITGTSGTLSHTTSVTLVVANPTADFALSATPASQSVPHNGTTTYTVKVTPSNGFNGTVSFAVSGLPNGATASFNPTTVTGSGSTTMTVTTGHPRGTFPLTITGTSGALSHTASVSLTVTK